VAGSGYEYVGEMYYSWSPVPSVFMRPNLQYIFHPEAPAKTRMRFVLGLKARSTF